MSEIKTKTGGLTPVKVPPRSTAQQSPKPAPAQKSSEDEREKLYYQHAPIVALEHPMVQHFLTEIRQENTDSGDFREKVKLITHLMVYEVTKNLPTEKIEIQTPMGKTIGTRILGKNLVVCPIMRAGNIMGEAFLEIIKTAKCAHIGLYRDEKTITPVQYFFKAPPELENRECYVCDPMLATGGSAIKAVDMLKAAGAKDIKFLCLVAAPEGLTALQAEHPDVKVYYCALDERLNSKKYILPGLGDAGDRIYGTQ